jgi:hypothetical protein
MRGARASGGELIWRRTVLGWTLGTLPLALAFAGCGPPDREPCLGLQAGDRIKVTIIGRDFPASPSSPTTCDDALALQDGRELTATIRSVGGGDRCISAHADFDAVGAWTWEYSGTPDGESDLEGHYSATSGLCSGDITLRIDSDALPSSDWDPMRAPPNPPPASMRVSYRGSGDDPACPSACAPAFGIRLERLGS